MFMQVVYSGQEEKIYSRTQELDANPVMGSMRKGPVSFLNGEQMYIIKNGSQLLTS